MPKIPKLRHHKATGRALVVIDGRYVYCGRWDTPEAEARYRAVVGAWLATGLPPADESTLTIGELAVGFLRHSRAYYRKADGSATSEHNTIVNALKPLLQMYRHELAADFGPLKLKAVREQMIASNLARSTINSRVQRIVRMFKWAVENELCPAPVYQALATVRTLQKGRTDARETKKVTVVAWADVQACKEHVHTTVWAAILVQYHAAARSSEILSLRPIDIDTTGEVWKVRLADHKTAHHDIESVLTFGPRAQKVLRERMQGIALDGYIFPAIKFPEKPLNKSTYYHEIRKACGAAKVPRWSPHRLRHTKATEVRKEKGLEAAQIFLRHSKADVTQVYAERDHSLAASLAAELG